MISKLKDFSTSLLSNRYLLPGETMECMFKRVANAYGEDAEHTNRIFEYMQKKWFMPATPILSNAGSKRGLPISCFLNECEDSLSGISDLFNECIWLASQGGGIGSYWGNVRSIGEKIGEVGQTCGIIPFLVVQDSLASAISQGSLRRGSTAVFLTDDHPEVEKFIDMRRPSKGGSSELRTCLNLHHGIMISDAFMNAVVSGSTWKLRSPVDKSEIGEINARDLWKKILITRLETGEPYIIYSDTINDFAPEIYKKLGLKIKTSNLCSEITLHTGKDHRGDERTGVCCLSSVNVQKFDEWKSSDRFIYDIFLLLKNVLNDFISRASSKMSRASYSASRERSVGLGMMGFHSYLQSKMIPFEESKKINLEIISHIKHKADIASKEMARIYGPCPDAIDANLEEYFTNKLAIAPTASISIIAGCVSPGTDPISANIFSSKTLSGNFVIKNPYLEDLLESKGKNTDRVWSKITDNLGSVRNLDFLSNYEKNVFKTAFEIDQFKIIELAGDRAPFVCQSQSVNLFLKPNISVSDLHNLHIAAWRRKVKSLYYCRSYSHIRPITP